MYTGLVSCHERGYQERPCQMCYAALVRKVAYAGKAVITPPRSLGRCAPAVRLRRALPSLTEQAQTLSTDSGTTHNRAHTQKKTRKRPRRCRFSIGSASPRPASHLSKLYGPGLGETRCGLKMPTVSGKQLPPAASTFPPYRLPDTLPPFSLAGLVALSHSSRAFLFCGISGDLGSSLQAWAVMQDPPVQPDCCASSGNCSLEANPERHALTPLAAATGN